MKFEMKKFGIILNSRLAGQEAVLRVRQIANGLNNDKLTFDFSGVEVLTPSFADQFFSGIKESYKDKKIAIEVEGFTGNTIIEDVLRRFSLLNK